MPAQSRTEANWWRSNSRAMPSRSSALHGEDGRAAEPRVVGLADAEDLAGIFCEEIVQGVVARHAGESRDQQRQRQFVGRRSVHGDAGASGPIGNERLQPRSAGARRRRPFRRSRPHRGPSRAAEADARAPSSSPPPAQSPRKASRSGARSRAMLDADGQGVHARGERKGQEHESAGRIGAAVAGVGRGGRPRASSRPPGSARRTPPGGRNRATQPDIRVPASQPSRGIINWKSPKWKASRKVCRGVTSPRLMPAATATAKASMARPTEMPSTSNQFTRGLRGGRGSTSSIRLPGR